MSKIQEALKRIQGNSSESAAARTSAKRPARVARVEVETPTSVDNPEDFDGRIVNVDMGLLRAAGLIAPESQARQVADQYRIIKRPLLDLAKGKGAEHPKNANLIMVASAMPGDGKTFNALNIALSIASEKDTSVLLVDADVAKPQISNLFGVNDQPGLIDLLANPDVPLRSTILRTDVPGLSLLPAGTTHDYATELLASQRMQDIADELASSVSNRIVIFDSPPILVTSESRELASRVGQIVLVVCAGQTHQQAVEAALRNLDQDKAINLVLNQAGSTLGENMYGQYGYGYEAQSNLAAL